MKKLLKIDCIMYRVKDLEKSAKFYENNLGLKRAWKDEKKGMIGFLFPENNSEMVIYTDESIPSPTFCFSVEDVVAFCKEYEAAGNKVLKKPVDVRMGKFAIIADSDGNELPIIDLTKFGGKPQYD